MERKITTTFFRYALFCWRNVSNAKRKEGGKSGDDDDDDEKKNSK